MEEIEDFKKQIKDLKKQVKDLTNEKNDLIIKLDNATKHVPSSERADSRTWYYRGRGS